MKKLLTLVSSKRGVELKAAGEVGPKGKPSVAAPPPDHPPAQGRTLLSSTNTHTNNTLSWLHSSLGLWHSRLFVLEEQDDGHVLRWYTADKHGAYTGGDALAGEMWLTMHTSVAFEEPASVSVVTDGSRVAIKYADAASAHEWARSIATCIEDAKEAYVAKLVEQRAAALAHPKLEYASSCWLPTTWVSLPLLGKEACSSDTSIFTFGIPDDGTRPPHLNLPTCACILLRAPGCGRLDGGGKDDWSGSDAVRPYTPFLEEEGQFKLLVKRYTGGAVSPWLHRLAPGAHVQFKHIPFNIKVQYPFEGRASFSLICAGTGITPIYQALKKIVETDGDERPVTLLYGNRRAEDVLLREQLEAWAATMPQLTLVHVLSASGADHQLAAEVKAGTVRAGRVSQELIQEFCAPPSADTLVFVCGPPPMYDSLCGARGDKALSDDCALARLGYTQEMVAKM